LSVINSKIRSLFVVFEIPLFAEYLGKSFDFNLIDRSWKQKIGEYNFLAGLTIIVIALTTVLWLHQRA
jgi:hypothetical protein